LAQIKSLKRLNLYDCPITDAGIEKLQSLLPECQIVREKITEINDPSLFFVHISKR